MLSHHTKEVMFWQTAGCVLSLEHLHQTVAWYMLAGCCPSILLANTVFSCVNLAPTIILHMSCEHTAWGFDQDAFRKYSPVQSPAASHAFRLWQHNNLVPCESCEICRHPAQECSCQSVWPGADCLVVTSHSCIQSCMQSCIQSCIQ